jgi:hypothetical protein
MIEPPDLEGMVERATKGLDAAQRLEDRVGGELDRREILRQLTLHDKSKGQPMYLDLGEGASIASTQGKDLGGSLPSDAVLAAEYRWALAKVIGIYTQGHFGIATVDGMVRAIPADALGAAWLRVAERLTRGQPGSALIRRRPCAWCGEEFAYERSTKRYCSNAHKQAMLQARRQARKESPR